MLKGDEHRPRKSYECQVDGVQYRGCVLTLEHLLHQEHQDVSYLLLPLLLLQELVRLLQRLKVDLNGDELPLSIQPPVLNLKERRNCRV